MGSICTKRTSPIDHIQFSTIIPTATSEDKLYYNPFLQPLFACIPLHASFERQLSNYSGEGTSSHASQHDSSAPSMESVSGIDDEDSPTTGGHVSTRFLPPVTARSRSPSNRSAASPDQLCISFIPKERCILVIVGNFRIQSQWKWMALSWRECMQYARILWRKKYQFEDEGSPEMVKNSEQWRQQWNAFKTELEKCFWRKELRFDSNHNVLELDFLELGAHLTWEGFVPVHHETAQSELLPNLYSAYREFWDHKVSVERKKDIAQKQREETEQIRKELRDVRQQLKELESENVQLKDEVSEATQKLALNRRTSFTLSGSGPRLSRHNSLFNNKDSRPLTVDVESEDDDEEEDESFPRFVDVPTPTGISTLHSSLLNKKRFGEGDESPTSPPLSPRSSRPSSADSETQTLARNLPVNRVLATLAKVRKTLSPANKDRIDWITDIIKNDMLYEIDVETLAKGELDSEIRSWIKTEFKLENVKEQSTPKSRWRAAARMVTFAKALHRDSSMRLAREEIVLDIPPEVEECLADIDSMTKFDIFKLDKVSSHRPLYYVGLALFRKYKFFQRYNISAPRLKHFLTTLENGYLLNPYHNKLHAADVTQCVHAILQTGNMLSNLSDLDIFSIILAALVHDFKHPGRTNAFEMKKLTERALLFNDQSVLENYHCTEAFRVLSQEKNNILANLKDQDFRYVRNMLISLVLATDITHHFTVISQAQSTIIKKYTKSKKEDVTLLLRLILKCSDVSNPARPIHLAKKWAERIMEEFFEQGDEEKRLHYPVSPFMDREKSSIETCQCGFIVYIAKPIFDCLQKFSPDCMVYYQNLGANEREWQRVAKEKEAAQLEEAELEANYQKTHNIHKVEEVEGEDGEEQGDEGKELKPATVDDEDSSPAMSTIEQEDTNDATSVDPLDDEQQKPAVKSALAGGKPEPIVEVPAVDSSDL